MPKTSKKTYFDELWLKDERLGQWLQQVPKDRTCFRCKLCSKVLSVEAIKSHESNAKHRGLAAVAFAAAPIQSFLQPSTLSSALGESQSHASSSTTELSITATSAASNLGVFNDDARTRAEILWVLKIIDSNYSFNSSECVPLLLQSMFPDSEVAKNFSCSESKARYMATFGLAPYLLELLMDKVKDDCFVLLFDESLNIKVQQKQLDIYLRFWNGNEVQSRYFTSIFMGHARAVDIEEDLKKGIESLQKANLLQLSMDGPNVNWKVFEDLQSEIQLENGKNLLNVGSCGLHVIHGAFRSAMSETGWDIETLLTSAYRLFKDSPARREDFSSISTNHLFPLKFVVHRWVENVRVLERFLEVLPDLRKYTLFVMEKKLSDPHNKSFDTVKGGCQDLLAEPKLNFALTLAKQQSLLHNSKRTQLSKVDLRDRSHHKQVDLGFSAEMYLQSAEFRKMKISDKDVLGIRISAKAALITFTEKVLEKSPMRYPLARSISCLDPHFIAQSPDACKTMLTRMLKSLVDAKRLQGSVCDEILQQFEHFMRSVLSSELLQFKPGQDRLDIFLHDKMCTPYPKLWMAVRMALLLSHGQATIERGFSVNKKVVIENQQTKNLIARRLIKDHIIQAGGILQVSITKQMMISVRSARSRYSQYLADKKECEVKERAHMKRKAELDAIEELRMKTKRLKSDIDALHISVKKYAEKCETTGDLTYIAKSNSLRRTADEKEEELKKVNEELDAKIEKYKQ
ncbi:hypothetical protein EMCRGX_G034900 [Ephydatia muelleri]